MNWDRVARYLETAAREHQDTANAATGRTQDKYDTLASIARMVAAALRFGLDR